MKAECCIIAGIIIVVSLSLIVILDRVVISLFRDNKELSEMLDLQKQWHRCLINGYGMPRYFKANNIKTIGIYGYNVLGRQLFDELYGTGVNVLYFIDDSKKKMWNLLPDCNVISVEDIREYECPDAIIIVESGECDIERKVLENHFDGVILPVSWLVGICRGL